MLHTQNSIIMKKTELINREDVNKAETLGLIEALMIRGGDGDNQDPPPSNPKYPE